MIVVTAKLKEKLMRLKRADEIINDARAQIDQKSIGNIIDSLMRIILNHHGVLYKLWS